MRSKGSTYTHTYSFFKLFKVLYKVLNFKAATHGGSDGRVVQGNRLTTFVVEPVVLKSNKQKVLCLIIIITAEA